MGGRRTQRREREFRFCADDFMNSVKPQDLRRDLDALLERVEAGERFVVIRDGQPVAELRPIPAATTSPRPFGLCMGAFTVPDDFDAPLPEAILRDFDAC